MQSTPKANRLHISVFGRRNSGKSSLINALTGEQAALVSDLPGTTTDPVYLPFELQSLGPVIIIDTAGIDDETDVGRYRVQKSREVMDETDLGIVIFSGEEDGFKLEKVWYRELNNRHIPVVGVISKVDERYVDIEPLEMELNIPFVKISAKTKFNLGSLRDAVRVFAPAEFERASVVGDLVKPADTVILVMPKDIPAPKYRLVASQQQVLRDLLDHRAMALSVTEEELQHLLTRLKHDPDLVITDSAVFDKVDGIVPPHVPLTTFAILMARFKGDLEQFVEGAKVIDTLRPGDRVLLSEACIHHPQNGEIDRSKLPAWLEERAGGPLDITVSVGHGFPEDIRHYKLIIHCGGCIFNRKQLMNRILRSAEQGVPITNYGIAFAHLHGILPRVTDVFHNPQA